MLLRTFLAFVLFTNSLSAQVNPDADSDSAFSNLADFANTNANTTDIGDAAAEFLAPLDNSSVDVSEVENSDVARAEQELRYISEEDLEKPDIQINGAFFSLALLAGGQKSLENLMIRLYRQLTITGDEKNLKILFNSSPMPQISVERIDLNREEYEDHKAKLFLLPEADKVAAMKRYDYLLNRSKFETRIVVPAGVLAFVKNVDELAALFAKAIATRNPQILGVSDDPNFYRNLENISAYTNVGPHIQREVKIDIAVMERLMAAQFNPWALYEFERRVHDWIDARYERNLLSLTRGFMFARVERLPGSFRSLRLQIQKDYLAYIAKKKDILDFVNHHQSFPKELNRLRSRVKLFVYPCYMNFLQFLLASATPMVLGSFQFYQYVAAAIAATGSSIQKSDSYQAFRGAIDPAMELTAPLIGYASDHMVLLSALAAGTAAYKYFGPPILQIAPVIKRAAMATPAVVASHAQTVQTIGSQLLHGSVYIASRAASGTQYVAKKVWYGTGVLVVKTANGLVAVGKGTPHAVIVTGKFLFDFSKSLAFAIRQEANIAWIQVQQKVRKFEVDAQARMQRKADNERDFQKLQEFLANPVANPQEIFGMLSQAIYLARIGKSTWFQGGIPPNSPIPALDLRSGEALNYFEQLLRVLNSLLEKNLIDPRDLVRFNSGRDLEDLIGKIRKDPRFTDAFVSYSQLARPLLGERPFRSGTNMYAIGYYLSPLFVDENLDAKSRIKILNDIHETSDGLTLLPAFKNYLEKYGDQTLKELLSAKDLDPDSLKTFIRVSYHHRYRNGFNYGLNLKGLTPEQYAKLWAFNNLEYIDGNENTYRQDIKYMTRNGEVKIPQNWVKRAASITDLTKYIDKRFPDWVLSKYKRALFDAVVSRPELFKTREDVTLFLNRDYYWETVSSNSYRTFTNAELGFATYARALAEKHPNVWKYKHSDAEFIHELITKRLHELGLYPKDFKGRLDLFVELTSRGVSSTTDTLLQDLLKHADPEQEKKLSEFALVDGRAFDRTILEEFSARQFLKYERYQILRTLPMNDPQRIKYLESNISALQNLFKEGGIRYTSLLEQMSVEMVSTQEESRIIHEAKFWPKPSGSLSPSAVAQESNADQTFSAIYNLISIVTKWKKSEQFAFLLLLRGDADPTPHLQKVFPNLGPLRIRRTYQSLPVWARSTIVELLLEEGLLKNESLESGLGKKVIDHLISDGDKETQKAAREILSAFLYALGKLGDGNNGFQKKILGYLYALPKGEDTSIGHTLKQILEVFGATGIKVGQFLVAADLLPEATPILRQLQERADIPNREDMYADVREILGTSDLPFLLRNLLGAASLKYAFLAKELKSDQDVVIKIFRASAVNHVRTELVLLDAMADYLNRLGHRYGIFKTIVDAARRAVEKELVVSEESKKAARARNLIYVDLSDEKIKIQVPKEQLVKDRMLVSQFARGGSFNELPESLKRIAAQKILEIEGKILFSANDVIEFDPDRHAGNYRIYFQSYHGREHMVLESVNSDQETGEISPIDFGQLIKMKKSDREKITKLFALSQILTQLGPNDWMRNEVSRIFGLDANQSRLLNKSLRRYFPEPAFKEKVTAYFALLSAVQEAGFKNFDIAYVDFVRAIIQLHQYDVYVADKSISPQALFTREVLREGQSYQSAMALSTKQKIMLSTYNFWKKWTAPSPLSCEKLF